VILAGDNALSPPVGNEFKTGFPDYRLFLRERTETEAFLTPPDLPCMMAAA
jgi:hypothetical protein